MLAAKLEAGAAAAQRGAGRGRRRARSHVGYPSDTGTTSRKKSAPAKKDGGVVQDIMKLAGRARPDAHRRPRDRPRCVRGRPPALSPLRPDSSGGHADEVEQQHREAPSRGSPGCGSDRVSSTNATEEQHDLDGRPRGVAEPVPRPRRHPAAPDECGDAPAAAPPPRGLAGCCRSGASRPRRGRPAGRAPRRTGAAAGRPSGRTGGRPPAALCPTASVRRTTARRRRRSRPGACTPARSGGRAAGR